MNYQSKLKVAGYIFLVVGLMHLLRLVLNVPVTFGSWAVPLWVSALGAVAALGLSWWMLRK